GKIATGTGDDNRLDRVVERTGAKEIGQFAVTLERQGILALWTIKRHLRDAVVDLQQEMLRRIIRQRQRDGIGRSGHLNSLVLFRAWRDRQIFPPAIAVPAAVVRP